MIAKKFTGLFIAGAAFLFMALMPSISLGQGDTMFVWYGGPDTLNVNINEQRNITMYVGTPANVFGGDLHFVLGVMDQYVDAMLSESLGVFFYPLTEWDFVDFTPVFGSPPNPEGWHAQAVFGWARLSPDSEAPWLHFDVPAAVATFVIHTADDSVNIGDNVAALGPGVDPNGGPSNSGDTLGIHFFQVIEEFSVLHFNGGGYIAGHITDAADNPIEGVMITNEATGKVTYSLADGYYRMGVYPGTHNFTFIREEYFDTTVADLIITLNQTVTVDITLHQYGSVSGTVRNSQGNPLQGTIVSIAAGPTDTTGADGFYRLPNLEAGSYDISFHRTNYVDTTAYGINVELDQNVVLNWTLHQLGRITGIVEDASTHDPLDSVIVTLLPDSLVVDTTNSLGSYSLPSLRPGSYEVRFDRARYQTLIAPAVVNYDQVTQLNVFLEPIVGIDDETSAIPADYYIKQNFPNPFNAVTVIEYGLPEDSYVSIEIYDLLGRRVQSLLSEQQPAGRHQLTWNAANVTSGVYFYRIQAQDYSEKKSMLLLK